MKSIARVPLIVLTTAIALGSAPGAFAWGPHDRITAVAQAALPEQERARAAAWFGSDWKQLESYCLMPDQRRSMLRTFFPDDYLLWPVVPRHVDHMPPDVLQTYGPFFKRALQAMRTESPQNAARWIGSLIHFVEDTGAPPHAAGIKGELHKRLENWLDAKAITIGDYQPRLLGHDDRTATEGLVRRVHGLLAYSKVRAENIRDAVAALPAREDQPVILECADECARVVADLLHTLLKLGLSDSRHLTLSGHVTLPPGVPLPEQAAKVVLPGTEFSTLTDSNGCWSFYDLPAKPNRVVIERVGCATVLDAGKEVALAPSNPPGNLVRNPDFSLSWLTGKSPDHWTAIPPSAKLGGYESDPIRIRSNAVYHVGIAGAAQDVRVGVRWSTQPGYGDKTNVVWSATQEERELKPLSTAVWAQVLVLTKQPLANAATRVWLTPAP
jgi:hypothetical protein